MLHPTLQSAQEEKCLGSLGRRRMRIDEMGSQDHFCGVEVDPAEHPAMVNKQSSGESDNRLDCCGLLE